MSESMMINQGVKSGFSPLPEAIEKALVEGDLSKLTVEHRISYYNALCNSIGLNPLSKPFNYIVLNGKLTLYASKDCTDQLRSIHGVSVTDLESKLVDGIFMVVAKGRNKDGRTDAATGAVDLGKLYGDGKANAMMKAETKAKRRLTLSLCGLGMLDETEIETIKDAQPLPLETTHTNLEIPASGSPSQDEPVEERPQAQQSQSKGGKWTIEFSLTPEQKERRKAEDWPEQIRTAKSGKDYSWFLVPADEIPF